MCAHTGLEEEGDPPSYYFPGGTTLVGLEGKMLKVASYGKQTINHNIGITIDICVSFNWNKLLGGINATSNIEHPRPTSVGRTRTEGRQ